MTTIARRDGYELSADPARIDLGLVHGWLSEHAYWAIGRSREKVERSIAGSMSFGVYTDAGAQVAFARVVTDQATFAWLCDVFVDPSARGRGVGTWMVGGIVDHLRAYPLGRIMLVTHDAHGVYARFGFAPLARPDQWMELRP